MTYIEQMRRPKRHRECQRVRRSRAHKKVFAVKKLGIRIVRLQHMLQSLFADQVFPFLAPHEQPILVDHESSNGFNEQDGAKMQAIQQRAPKQKTKKEAQAFNLSPDSFTLLAEICKRVSARL